MRELNDLDAATAQRMSAAQALLSQKQRTQTEQEVQAALTEQRELLEQLAAIERKRVDVLHEADEASRALERQIQAARATLTRFLFWIPAPPSTKTIGALPPALAWTVAPENRNTAAEVMWQQLAERPFLPAVALIGATTLLMLRGRMLRTLVSLSPAVVGYEHYRIGHALAALAITLALPSGANRAVDNGRDALTRARKPSIRARAQRCAARDVQAPACHCHACVAR